MGPNHSQVTLEKGKFKYGPHVWGWENQEFAQS